MLDLKEGDILVVNGRDYPIRSCAEWAWGAGRAARRLMTVTAATKRQPAVVNGKRGAAVAYLADLTCTPLDPVDAELAKRMALDAPHEKLQTYVDGGNAYYHLVVEDIKR